MAKKLPELVDDLKTRIQALKDDVAAGKTVSESAVTLINGLLAQNQAFKEQLQAFIDTGATPEEAVEALQPIVDAMDTANSETDAARQALADAVAAGTPAEPPPA